MASKKKNQETELSAAASARAVAGVPVFVLFADRPGHINALIAAKEAMAQMPIADAAELVSTIREFELWMDANQAETSTEGAE